MGHTTVTGRHVDSDLASIRRYERARQALGRATLPPSHPDSADHDVWVDDQQRRADRAADHFTQQATPGSTPCKQRAEGQLNKQGA